MKKTFNINVSVLNNYTEKEIEETLERHSKRELLESLLTWQQIAKNHERNYDELVIEKKNTQ